MSTLTITIGDTTSHSAVLAVTNLDGSPATGATIVYSSDNPTIISVDPNTGLLGSPASAGVANITGTATRGAFAHSDTGAVTVTANANTGDFTVALALA